jgi:hypothetical protein
MISAQQEFWKIILSYSFGINSPISLIPPQTLKKLLKSLADDVQTNTLFQEKLRREYSSKETVGGVRAVERVEDMLLERQLELLWGGGYPGHHGWLLVQVGILEFIFDKDVFQYYQILQDPLKDVLN